MYVWVCTHSVVKFTIPNVPFFNHRCFYTTISNVLYDTVLLFPAMSVSLACSCLSKQFPIKLIAPELFLAKLFHYAISFVTFTISCYCCCCSCSRFSFVFVWKSEWISWSIFLSFILSLKWNVISTLQVSKNEKKKKKKKNIHPNFQFVPLASTHSHSHGVVNPSDSWLHNKLHTHVGQKSDIVVVVFRKICLIANVSK